MEDIEFSQDEMKRAEEIKMVMGEIYDVLVNNSVSTKDAIDMLLAMMSTLLHYAGIKDKKVDAFNNAVNAMITLMTTPNSIIKGV